jgi:uncharacterized tellurite resistance protein B-like protein
MNISDHFDSPQRKQNKEHFKHLIKVALSDGKIHDSEKKMLHRVGRKMGFTDPEIETLIESAKTPAFDTPYELSKRFEQLHDIIKMISADGIIENSEIRLARGLAIIYGFNDKEIPGLLDLMIDGIKNGKDEEELFKTFKNGRVIS